MARDEKWTGSLIILLALTLMLSRGSHATDGTFTPVNGGETLSNGVFLSTPALIGSGDADTAATLTLNFGPGVSTFRWTGCSPQFENATAQPQGQNATVGIDQLCNVGTIAGQVLIALNTAPTANWTLKASSTSITSNLVTLNTTPQTIFQSLDVGACAYVWMVANCSYVHQGPGAYEDYTIN